MLLRANVIATDFHGARPELIDLLVAHAQRAASPRDVPEQGSVGASGDLAPLAHRARAHRRRLGARWRGARGVAAPLARRGSRPWASSPRKGSADQRHAGATAVLALAGDRRAGALAHRGGGRDDARGASWARRPRSTRASTPRARSGGRSRRRRYPRAPGRQRDPRVAPDGDPRVQDAYSLRCMPQVHGAVARRVPLRRGDSAVELNASTDNPLVFDDGDVISGGNFHGEPVALASTSLAIALTDAQPSPSGASTAGEPGSVGRPAGVPDRGCRDIDTGS